MTRTGDEKSRVVLARCADYEPARLRRALETLLEPLGGIGAFVRPGQRVLLKPNLLSAKAPERAITTHPNIVEAVVRMVREAGGEPVVGDSPGGAVRGVERVWKNTEMAAMAERCGVPLVNFEAAGSRAVPFGEYTFFVAKPVLDADVIINLAKLKTHSLTLMTGAVKNMYGVVPGFRKSEYHKLYPKPDRFARMLVHLYKLVTPSVTIVDGILAMAGNGPSSGDPYDLGLLAAGIDGPAIDAVLADRIGFPAGAIDTTRIAAELGVGAADLSRIECVGDGADVRPEGFALPSNKGLRLVPEWLVKIVRPLVWVQPRIVPATCVGCGFCAESCPVEAIDREGDVYRIDRRRCVQCMCCHELCPHRSIEIDMSRLARFFS